MSPNLRSPLLKQFFPCQVNKGLFRKAIAITGTNQLDAKLFTQIAKTPALQAVRPPAFANSIGPALQEVRGHLPFNNFRPNFNSDLQAQRPSYHEEQISRARILPLSQSSLYISKVRNILLIAVSNP